MGSLRRASVLVLFLSALAGCTSSPLPANEVPTDFLFVWERVAPETEPAETEPAETEPAETASAEGSSEEVASGEEVPGENSEPVVEAPQPEEADSGWPARVSIDLEFGGFVTWRVVHEKPRHTESEGMLKLDSDEFWALYEAVRQAELFDLPETFTGNQEPRFRRTFQVTGRNQTCEIVVEGTTVEALEILERALLAALPMEEILAFPQAERRSVMLDLRSGIFYSASADEAAEIPEEFRKEYPHPWAALNDGGTACDGFPWASWN